MFQKIICLSLCVLFFAVVPARGETSQNQLPELTGYTLDGNRRSLPGDLGAKETLLILTYDNLAAEELASWRSFASKLVSDVPVLVVVLMEERGPRARAFAAGRLRGEVAEAAERARTLAVFTDIDRFRRRAAISGHSRVAALLVSNDGAILWIASGPPTQNVQAGLSGVLQVGPAPSPPPNALVPPVEAVTSALLVEGAATRSADKQVAPLQLPARPPRDAGETIPVMAKADFPTIEGYTLAGDRIRIPDDLAGTDTRLYILRRSNDISEMADDIAAMAAKQSGDRDWLALVYMGRSPKLGRAFAAGSLRREIADAALRRHVVPVFNDLSTLEAELGFDLPTLDQPVCISVAGALCAQVPAN